MRHASISASLISESLITLSGGSKRVLVLWIEGNVMWTLPDPGEIAALPCKALQEFAAGKVQRVPCQSWDQR